MSIIRLNRRRALEAFGTFLATSPLLRSQELIGEPAGRITPKEDLIDVFEMEAMAKRKLASTVFSTISGGDRAAFERITFRPRMLVNVQKLDLSVDLFGEKLYCPIVFGPIMGQQQFHPDGELASVRGAAASKTLMVVSGKSSQPIGKIAAAAKTPLWYQAFPDADFSAVQEAVAAGCKAVCLTVGTPFRAPHMNWDVIEQWRKRLKVPLVLKGIMSPEEAQAAVQRGIQGIVVSNYGGLLATGLASPLEMLPSIVDAVGAKIPVLVDGSFRRGTDILKALAFGARAVMIGRPAMWGLGAYGADGVQIVFQMLQGELARDMGHCGRPSIASIDRSLIKIHRR
jgi:4-hydroxymandelate oxidase